MEYIKKAVPQVEVGSEQCREQVFGIINNVIKNGDEALLEYNKKFDGNDCDRMRVTKEEIEEAYSLVDEQSISDMRKAAENIKLFANAQKGCMTELESVEITKGSSLGHKVIPISSACCYVPGGRYPLYSSALMLVIPAKVAGVSRIVATSPVVGGTTKIHPKTLVAMDIAGADEIYKIGGAHAVAAFAYGTKQIKPVDIIVGPGNRYVTEAKRQCYGKVGIDFIAGPSEVLIIADESANSKIIAADMLAQSEHDTLARAILLTTDKALGEQVLLEVNAQLETLETADVARVAFENNGEIVLCESLEEAAMLSNEYAPEHLEVDTRDEDILPLLTNYGSLFIGQETGEVFGDYASGTNHTLPTVGAARYTGGVWVGTFLKVCTYQKYSREAMHNIAPIVSRMARGEGLIAHARAAEYRQEILK